MSDKWEPTIEPTPCVDKNGVFVTKGMTVLYTSTAHTPPYGQVTQEGVVISDPVFTRNIWGDHYWIVDLKGSGWRTKFMRVATLEAIVVERVQREPSDAQQERAAIAAWLRSEPETVKECNGHRHKNGTRCIVIVPMSLQELAEAIESGSYPKENL